MTTPHRPAPANSPRDAPTCHPATPPDAFGVATMAQDPSIALICPECETPLQDTSGAFDCSRCKRSWPIVNGVPHFVSEFPYWGEIPLEDMQAVNREVQTRNWSSVLRESREPNVTRAAEMLLNLERANWQWLVDLPDTSRVLDIGAGMGTNSHALALHYREVVAVEPVGERVEFMRHRFRQEQLTNIKLVRGSVWALPFPPASFDLIAMNGVLEWVAEGQSEDPRQLQLRALRKLLRLLRPGGRLYLGIENRLGLGYFVGYPDPHCGLPFVTVLPRSVAHWYARRKGHRNGYRNYLYSAHGYGRLLREAGFSGSEVYLALPSYNHPRFLVPLDRNVFSYYSRNFNSVHTTNVRAAAHRLLLTLGVLPHTEYSFAIFARK